MIEFIKGKICEKSPATAVIEACGIGYEMLIPLSTYDALPPEGGDMKLYVHEVIREDAHTLYGFATKAERDFFRLLQNVSGIGPKTAIGAISGMTIRDLRTALAERDIKRLSKISGIGKKTAERIIVELSDKVNPLEAFAAEEKESPLAGICRDAVLALTQLGQPQEAAIKTVRELSKSANPPKTAEEFIKLALTPR
jgi:Holliday junction DNA helicase, RuvA subunit